MVSGSFDVVIVGGGASGLMCALTAGRRGRRVLVIDHNRGVGKKIVVSGGGRCNFTNTSVEPANFISSNPHFCKSALKRFTQWDFLAMVEKHGVLYEERDEGQLFCVKSSADILNMLLIECEKWGVTLFDRTRIKKVEAIKGDASRRAGFILETSRGSWEAASLVVATGGLSYPALGATNLGYELALKFGMSVLPAKPALVPLIFKEELASLFARLSGISLRATLESNGQSFTGELLFTHRGLSGPVVLQISNYWERGGEIVVDFFPGEDMGAWLILKKNGSPKSRIATLLAGEIPRKLLVELREVFWASRGEEAIGSIPDSFLKELGTKLNAWRITPENTEGFKKAEVTLGGVDTGGLSSKTMESRVQAGLYFVGEVVDVTGQLGGYNMQWAWSSGHAAGEYA